VKLVLCLSKHRSVKKTFRELSVALTPRLIYLNRSLTLSLSLSLSVFVYVFFPLYLCTPLHQGDGIEITYGFDDRGVRVGVPVGVKNFLFSRSSRPALRSPQSPIQWVPGSLSPGVKRKGREVDHSPPSSAEVKKMWIYTSTPIRLHGVVLN
jgi:hypothetical protein